MKPTLSKTAALAALAMLIGLPVQAHDTGRDDRMPRFEALDADGDGAVTEAELMAAAKARFAETDSNGDGVVTAEEMRAAEEARRDKRRHATIDRLDTNGDGGLSFAEITEKRDPTRMFGWLDRDNDGAISEEEFAEAKAFMKGRGGRHGDGARHRH